MLGLKSCFILENECDGFSRAYRGSLPAFLLIPRRNLILSGTANHKLIDYEFSANCTHV